MADELDDIIRKVEELPHPKKKRKKKQAKTLHEQVKDEPTTSFPALESIQPTHPYTTSIAHYVSPTYARTILTPDFLEYERNKAQYETAEPPAHPINPSSEDTRHPTPDDVDVLQALGGGAAANPDTLGSLLRSAKSREAAAAALKKLGKK